jgi:TetR/AcrR family transcriptional regulator, mexCD-oprJ operon repressor
VSSRPPHALQQRVGAAIIEAAARVFAARGPHASMSDVALEAGVARATLYRYFPSRQALLHDLVDTAVADAGARLADARIGQLPVGDAIPRAVRALVDTGDAFVVAVRERARGDRKRFDENVAQPLRSVCARAQQASELRADVSSEWLTEFLIATVMSAISAASPLGRDDMIELVASLFFEGARGQRPTLQVIA